MKCPHVTVLELEELRSGCPLCDAIPFLDELTTRMGTPRYLSSCGCIFQRGIVMSLWYCRRYF